MATVKRTSSITGGKSQPGQAPLPSIVQDNSAQNNGTPVLDSGVPYPVEAQTQIIASYDESRQPSTVIPSIPQLPDMLYFREHQRLAAAALEAYQKCDTLLDCAAHAGAMGDEDQYQELKAEALEWGKVDDILQERAHAMLNHAWGDPQPANVTVEGF